MPGGGADVLFDVWEFCGRWVMVRMTACQGGEVGVTLLNSSFVSLCCVRGCGCGRKLFVS